jgi:hypothetical protein
MRLSSTAPRAFLVSIAVGTLGCGPAPGSQSPDLPSPEPDPAPASDTAEALDAVGAGGEGAEASVDGEVAATPEAVVPTGPPVASWSQRWDVSQPIWGTLFAEAPGVGPVLFGGMGPEWASEAYQDTVNYLPEVDQWVVLDASGDLPGPRYCHCVAALPAHGQILVVGGRGPTMPLPPGAWTYSPATGDWQAIQGAVPQAVVGCHAAWLGSLDGGRAVVFSGQKGASMEAVTWVYDPTTRTFSQLATAHAPIGRRDGIVTEDPAGGRLLLHAGQTKSWPQPAYTNDLWAFDGSDWTELAPTGPLPEPRRFPAAAFDASRRRWLVFSGTIETLDFEELWMLDAEGLAWHLLEAPTGPVPEARGFAPLTYDPASDAFFLVGGYAAPLHKAFSEVWKLVLVPPG